MKNDDNTETERNDEEGIRDFVSETAEQGIQTDDPHLKETYQYANPYEFVREYAVNAFDAGAENFWISLRVNKDGTVTVFVRDDGAGMGKEKICASTQFFNSDKEDEEDSVGAFGLGMKSPVSLEGQCGFVCVSSTGTETWRYRTGAIASDAPFDIEQIEPCLPRGTTFEITYAMPDNTPQKEMEKMVEVLNHSIRYLPLLVHVDSTLFEDKKQVPRVFNANWQNDPRDRCSFCYEFRLGRNKYSAVLSIGSTRSHDLYSKGVYVTNKNCLFSEDLNRNLSVPHVSVRVECAQFELPIGRHDIRNERVLRPMSEHLRKRILPDFIGQLVSIYNGAYASEFDISYSIIEDIISTLIYRNDLFRELYGEFPLYRTRNRNQDSDQKLTYNQLRQEALRHQVIFIDDGSVQGMDFSKFKQPVLCSNQPECGKSMIGQMGVETITLGKKDLVMEAPASLNTDDLSPVEKRFESYLGFNKEAINASVLYDERKRRTQVRDKGTPLGSSFGESDEDEDLFGSSDLERTLGDGLTEEIRQGRRRLADISWRVARLVQSDGVTPCKSMLFLLKKGTVILNLHHEDILRLVVFSEYAPPSLAAHFAMALALEGENSSILPHLSADIRESLLELDILGRLNQADRPACDFDNRAGSESRNPSQGRYQTFMRNAENRNWE